MKKKSKRGPLPIGTPPTPGHYQLMPDVTLALQTGRGSLMSLAIQRVRTHDEMTVLEAIEVLRLLGDLIDDVDKLQTKVATLDRMRATARAHALNVQGELAKLIYALTPDKEAE